MNRKVKLHTDRLWLPEGENHLTLLYPFWGMAKERNDPDVGRFDEYIQNGKNVFELTNEQEAEFFLLPFEFSFETPYLELTKTIAEKAALLNKKVIIFYNSDFDDEIPIPNAIVFRTSFFSSRRRKNEFSFPGWSIDFTKAYQIQPFSETGKMPSVGYCGYVDYLNWTEQLDRNKLTHRFFKRTRTFVLHEQGSQIRGKAVRLLMKDKRIRTNIIIRAGFWAAGMDQQLARDQYVSNIVGSGYGLAMRGAGNFSYRLYEILSSGRIPLFVNTDCVLPFDHIVDWKKKVVWVEEKDVRNIADILVNYHKSLTDEQFLQKQMECRKFYEEYLSPLGFFTNMHQCLELK